MNRKKINVLAALSFSVAILCITPQAFAQSKEQIDAMKKLQAAALKKTGHKTTDELPAFIKKLKAIKIGSDSEDDVINQIGEPSTKNILFGTKVWRYEFMSTDKIGMVICNIEYDVNQKVSYINVVKGGIGGNEMLYSQGSAQIGPNAVSSNAPQTESKGETPVAASAPVSPKEGQIYFNSTDKHFYGWNGTVWKQLD